MCLAVYQVDGLAGWLAGWLAEWLIRQSESVFALLCPRQSCSRSRKEKKDGEEKKEVEDRRVIQTHNRPTEYMNASNYS